MRVERDEVPFQPYKICIDSDADSKILEAILLCASNYVSQRKQTDGEGCALYNIPCGQIDAVISMLIGHVGQ